MSNQKKLNDLTPLKDLAQLQLLYVNNTQVNDLTPLKDLTQLQLLDVSLTQVNNLTLLKDLTQLQLLDINNTQVSDLTPLKDLTQLQLLYVSSTQVSDLTSLKDLSQLQELYVSSTQVSDLTPLKDLSQLQELSVSLTQVSNLTPLRNLAQLQMLELDNTKVSDLTPLKDLAQLQWLDVSSTQASDLTPLKNLAQLQWLDVSYTQVSDLTPSKGLAQLQQFDVSLTQVSDLTPLKDLAQLQRLSVYNTQVSDLTPLKDLAQLEQLDVYNTQVSDLTPLKAIIEKGIEVKWAEYEEGILVANCPLSNPPREIVVQGNAAILSYWEQIEKEGQETLNEAKLIIVGEGKSGKTTLFKKLIEQDYQLETLDETHGINIHEGLAMAADFKANLWDFGGQELQYMTHQFFLTPRALYVLMMDARQESPNLSYWFKIISLLGKDQSTEKVQLLLVTNKHRDDTTGTPQYETLLNLYQDDFDCHPLVVNLSKNDKRWELLKETIENKLSNLPIVKNPLPKQWTVIRETLREEAKTHPYITTDRLHEICSVHNVTEERYQWQMTQYLHQLGSLLHFQEDDALSCDVFLQPKWVVEAVYALLKNEKIKVEQHGKFTKEDIFHILRGNHYTRAETQKILNLMSVNNFDICYKSDNGDYVATQLLPDNPPPQYQWHTHTGALQFRYQYRVMPKGLISRLIVRLSAYLEKIDGVDIVYKQGAILNIDINGSNCRVMLKEDDALSKTGLKQIIVEVLGEDERRTNRKYALQKVREEVESLHKKWFRNIGVEQIVPCNCDVCRTSNDPHTYEFSKIVNLPKPEVYCYKTQRILPSKQVLEGVYEQEEIRRERHGFDPDFRGLEGEGSLRKSLRLSEIEEKIPHITIINEVKPVIQTLINTPSVSQADLATIQALLTQLTEQKQEQLKEYVELLPEPETPEEKASTGKQIIKWLNKNAEGLVGNVAASVYYDALKGLLGIG